MEEGFVILLVEEVVNRNGHLFLAKSLPVELSEEVVGGVSRVLFVSVEPDSNYSIVIISELMNEVNLSIEIFAVERMLGRRMEVELLELVVLLFSLSVSNLSGPVIHIFKLNSLVSHKSPFQSLCLPKIDLQLVIGLKTLSIEIDWTLPGASFTDVRPVSPPLVVVIRSSGSQSA